MARHTDTHHSDLIEKVMETAAKRLGTDKGGSLAPFIQGYFANVPLRDIHGETPDDLFGAAFSHWRLAANRSPGVAMVRVYNPRLDEHGWRSEHTVVEIVTDNMPFLVDSVTAEFNRRDLVVHLVIHPMFAVRRDGAGNLVEIADRSAAGEGFLVESFMHLEVTHQSGETLDDLARGIEQVLEEVRAAVEDWQPMRERLAKIVDGLEGAATGRPPEEIQEVRAFLEWLRENHFTFLGFREYAVNPEDARTPITMVPGSGLGVLRSPDVFVVEDVRDTAHLPAAVRAFVARDEVVTITKADRKARVHRPVPMDVIGVRTFDPEGRVTGLAMFVGLFTAAAYTRTPNAIPLIRRKIRGAIDRAGFDPTAHDGKALLHILETYPRDELLQVSEDHLFQTALGILHLQERQRVALFVRRDDYDRFVTSLIFVPRDRYTTALRIAIQGIVERAFQGRVVSQFGEVGDSPLARLYMVVRTQTGNIPAYDAAEVEAAIVDATRTWGDRLLEALIKARGEEASHRLHRRYAAAFPAGYQERFTADEAVADIESLEATLAAGAIQTALYRPFAASDQGMRFKIYHPDDPIVLSQVLPMLEHMGLRVIDEVPHAVHIGADSGRTVMIHDFGLESESGRSIDLGAIREPFRQAFLDVWRGEAESDRFNSLVLEAGLACREVVILRAYSKYLRQAGIAFSQAYMEQVLVGNPELARLLVDLFQALFDPGREAKRDAGVDEIRQTITASLEAVVSADDDRIIRRFVNAVESTLRTNFFQRAADGRPKAYLAFKFDSRKVDELPLPRPMFEVFVYSPRMEGIHLRGGKVARGGLRWSDRREDFRTEVLGLMKAQMVKNAVIVPVGSKGGFVLKRPPNPADREAFQAEGVACYKTLIRGLLDLTDNRVGDEVEPPPDVVRRDDDDPYLVVAADKGTATFSDIANGVSAEYRFWLGDAFASGGSAGYDHKKMGITARGAWESVERHFREIGTNIQAEPFTVVGVGDMSGDVFGNGMLLSPCIRLLAAFNHLHIFVDPDPDPAVSLVERKRLFELPRSSWSDYDSKLISPGGAVFDRRAKSVTLSPEIRECFGIGAARTTPQELIRVLLRADVDLLWFGGIGTYVKARTESHADVGDRMNDALRIDASELRCRVVGEGANLGLTQHGRIEYARAGGRINTDFIDNSAGVDCSDHEVNIKILLDPVVAEGDLTEKRRNALLESMTDEVADLVLRDNYLQTQAITLIQAEGAGSLDNQSLLMRMFERQGRLDRGVEALPDEEVLAERAAAGEGLTRPEIAVLFSYCKMWLYDEVVASDLPDDRHMSEDVVRYFPTPIQERFKDRIFRHRLRRELIATSLTNSLINRVGGTFVTEIAEKAGMPPVDIARAYIIARDVYSARGIWEQIEALDNVASAAMQTTLHREVQRLLERSTLWFLRNGGTPIDITANVEAYKSAVGSLAEAIASVLPEDMNARILHRAERYVAGGVPEDLARRIAYLIAMPPACDIVRIAVARDQDVEAVARLYFSVGEFLGFGWLRYQAEKLPTTNHWQKLALAATVEELYAHQSALAVRVMEAAGRAGDGAIDTWASERRAKVERMRGLLSDLEATSPVDLSMLTVASRQLGALIAA